MLLPCTLLLVLLICTNSYLQKFKISQAEFWDVELDFTEDRLYLLQTFFSSQLLKIFWIKILSCNNYMHVIWNMDYFTGSELTESRYFKKLIDPLGKAILLTDSGIAPQGQQTANPAPKLPSGHRQPRICQPAPAQGTAVPLLSLPLKLLKRLLSIFRAAQLTAASECTGQGKPTFVSGFILWAKYWLGHSPCSDCWRDSGLQHPQEPHKAFTSQFGTLTVYFLILGCIEVSSQLQHSCNSLSSFLVNCQELSLQ